MTSKFKKFLFVLLALGLLIGSSGSVFAQTKTLSLNLVDKTVKEVLDEIEKQSGYLFFYSDGAVDLKRKVEKFEVKNQALEKALDKLFAGTTTTCTVQDRQVFFNKKGAPPATTPSKSSKNITGFVYDENGEGIPGATVSVKGTSRGVMADVDGSFKLDVSPADVLTVTYLGYETYTLTVGDKTEFIIPLKPKVNELDEVTIVAFGKQKKSSVVASIETVKAADLRVPASNLTSAFAGKIPGLISYQTSGEPGADNAQFFVRGVTTFGYAASPLILVDGFESTADDLARMTPDDIESFSILKDASAAVLYGSRGANGIILVTTKSGREGKVKINARVDVNVSTPTALPEMIGGVEYMQLYNQALQSRYPDRDVYYDEQKIQSTMRGENSMMYPNVDWYDMLFNRQTVNTKANLSVSGGGAIANYFVSAGYENENGLLKVDNRNNFNNNINIDRFNLRNNVIFKLSSTTTLDTRLQARYEKYTGPSVSAGDIFNMVMEGNPVDFPAVFTPDDAHIYTQHTLFGSRPVGTSGWKTNPYAEMVKGYESRDETTVTAQATVLQDLNFITEGLKFQAKVSAGTWSKYGMTRSYQPFFYDVESYDIVTDKYRLYRINNNGTTSLGDAVAARNTSSNYYLEARANWDRTFGSHSIGAMTVVMLQENLFSVGGGSLAATLPERNVGNSGRLTYDYDDRYFAEFGYGYNGSEKFTGSKRFGFFPSIGAGWLISNESFWASAKDYIDLLKLKFTWGQVGNDNISARDKRFQFLSKLAYTTDAQRSYNFGQLMNNSYNGYIISGFANPNIGWEVSEKYNIGVELGLLKDGPLKLQADVFKDNRRNIFMLRSDIPATTGFGNIEMWGNIGEMESKGIDASIDYQKFFNKDSWLTGRANFTYAVNKYIEYDEPDYKYEYLYRKGRSTGVQWGYVAERLFVDDAEVAQSPAQNFGVVQAGDIKYKDVNGDGRINQNDMVAMGFPTTPEIQYGFGLSGGYKNFDLSFFFQGNARVSFFIDPRGNYDSDGDGSLDAHGIAPFINRRNALAIVTRGAWTETNPDVHAFWPRLSTEDAANNTQVSSWWLRDGSFLRMKSIEAGYTFNGIKRLGLESCRAYFSAENLFVISPFKEWDPEMGGSGMGYPLNRRFNVGLQLAF